MSSLLGSEKQRLDSIIIHYDNKLRLSSFVYYEIRKSLQFSILLDESCEV